MAERDIGKFTKLAESGQGCALRVELMKMPFEESLKLLNQITAQSHKDHQADPAVDEITVSNLGGKFASAIGLYRRTEMFSYDELLLNKLQITNVGAHQAGDREITCTDVKS